MKYQKLPKAEAEQVFPKRGHMDLSEYTEMLNDLQLGDVLDIELDGSLTVRALKRRLGSAGRKLGMSLKYKLKNDHLYAKSYTPTNHKPRRRPHGELRKS